MDNVIEKLWNGDPVKHDPVTITLSETTQGFKLDIHAPFFNDPAPPGVRGKPLWLLWDYEVVEAFFLNSETGEYLELEYSPHGQHLGLLFKTWREFWKTKIPLDFTSSIKDNTWSGCAHVSWDYLPAGTNKFNMYAIHGQGSARQYEALFPVPKEKFNEPDFHRLDYFGDLNVKKLFPSGIWDKDSASIWKTEVDK